MEIDHEHTLQRVHRHETVRACCANNFSPSKHHTSHLKMWGLAFIILLCVTTLLQLIHHAHSQENMHTWSACRKNVSYLETGTQQRGTCHNDGAWWYNMSEIGGVRLFPTIAENGQPYYSLVPEAGGISIGMMWLGDVGGTSSDEDTQQPPPPPDDVPVDEMYRRYLQGSRIPLYIGGSGLAVRPDAMWNAGATTAGVTAVVSTIMRPATAMHVTYAAYSSTGILVEFLIDCTANSSHVDDCGIAVQCDMDLRGSFYQVVFRRLRAASLWPSNVEAPSPWSLTGFILGNSEMNFASVAPAVILPIAATVASPNMTGGAFPLSDNALVVSVNRQDTIIITCMQFYNACEKCVSFEGGLCRYHSGLNGGMCLPRRMGTMYQTDVSASPIQCQLFGDNNVVGPCYGRDRSSCVIQLRTPERVKGIADGAFSSSNETTLHPHEEVFTVPPTDYRRPLGSVYGRLPGSQRANLTAAVRNSTIIDVFLVARSAQMSLNMSCTLSNELVWRIVRLPSPPFAVNATVHSSLSVSMHSKWCGAPFMTPSACSAFVITVALRASDNAPVEAIVVVEYFFVSGVVAVHVVGRGGVGMLPPAFLAELLSSDGGWDGGNMRTSSLELSSLPNRSTYFVPSYLCLTTCVHGSCSGFDGKGLCVCHTLWRGAGCDVPADQFPVASVTLQSNTHVAQYAECPVCEAGICSVGGTCLCPLGFSGPRCESRCQSTATPSHKKCVTNSSASSRFYLCGSCICFTGFKRNATASACELLPSCDWNNALGGTLLMNDTCRRNTIGGETLVPSSTTDITLAPSHKGVVGGSTTTPSSSVLRNSNALLAMFVTCIVAVCVSISIQVWSFRQKLRRSTRIRPAPIESVGRLLPSPQLIST